MPCIELFPFRYRDPKTGKWIRARHVATRAEIARRYAEGRSSAKPRSATVDPEARSFTPHKSPLDAELRRYSEQQATTEAFLLGVFLRRYVTYCARCRRFAAMNGAARMFAEVRATMESNKNKPPERAALALKAVTRLSRVLALVRAGEKQQGGFEAEALPAQRLGGSIYAAAPLVSLQLIDKPIRAREHGYLHQTMNGPPINVFCAS